MSFHKSINDMIDKYGTQVEIERNSSKTQTKAFVQPLRHQTRVYSDMSIGISGYKDNRYYLYIGRPDVQFLRGENAIITASGKQYVVHTSESYSFLGKDLYVWAVLVPYKKERLDEYDAD